MINAQNCYTCHTAQVWSFHKNRNKNEKDLKKNSKNQFQKNFDLIWQKLDLKVQKIKYYELILLRYVQQEAVLIQTKPEFLGGNTILRVL